MRTTAEPHTVGPTAATSTTGVDSGAGVNTASMAPGPDRIGDETLPLLLRSWTSVSPTGMVTRALRAPTGMVAGVTESAVSQLRGAARAAGTSPVRASRPRTTWMVQPGATFDPRTLVCLTGARFYSCVCSSIRASPYPIGGEAVTDGESPGRWRWITLSG